MANILNGSSTPWYTVGIITILGNCKNTLFALIIDSSSNTFPYNSSLGHSTVREDAVEVAEKDPLMYSDGGLALRDVSQMYCPES